MNRILFSLEIDTLDTFKGKIGSDWLLKDSLMCRKRTVNQDVQRNISFFSTISLTVITYNPSACSCGGFLFARQAPSGGGYAGFVTGQRTKMAGKVL